jgi:tRNA-dihydrouridine synthase B
MHIGPYTIDPPVILAPMAGVTDRPFRLLCRRLGAGLALSEMTSSDPTLWHTEKSRLRRDHTGEPEPVAVQIAGYDPAMMAEAARFNVDHGAQIIDINMGCPAKKVCRVDAGSALLKDETLVARICEAVVRAVSVLVTWKIRICYTRRYKNAPAVARIAQDSGIAALTVHGRTREDHYEGQAEHDTLAALRDAVDIPLIANGDIFTPEQARAVLEHTGADAVMLGRAAQGRPWIFREVGHFLTTGRKLGPPSAAEVSELLLGHLDALYEFYGEGRGVRVARKHIQWYCRDHTGASDLWHSVREVSDAQRQRRLVADLLDRQHLPRAA